MTDPYAGPRAAVTAWANAARPTGTLAAPGAAEGPAEGGGADSAPGIYDPNRGALVATFPAAGYPRYLDWLNCKCSYSGVVEVFAGSIDELGRITSYGDGSLAEYDPNSPRFIPQGAALYVVWTVPSNAYTASAKAGMRAAV